MWSQPFTAFRTPFSRSPFARRAGSVLRYPEAGLTGGTTLLKATPLNAFVNKATHALFACDFIDLDPSVDGFLWESGGSGFGNYVGFAGGELVVRAFNGGARWQADTAYLTSAVPTGTGTLSWAIEIGATSRVRAWWNGVELAQNGQSVGSRADWGGADEGMFLGSGSGGIVIGEIPAATALVSAAYVSDLRYYSGQKAGAGKISMPDAISFTALAEASTAAQPFPNLLANDDIAASSIVSIDGIAITGGGSATTVDTGAGSFTVGSDGAASFDPGVAFAYLPLGRTATASAVYVTDVGGSARINATVAGALQLAYALAIEDGGSITGDPIGVIGPGTAVELSGLAGITAETVGSITRTGGAAGIAALTFASDGAYLGYAYLEAPAIYLLAFALRIVIPAGTTTGRIAETQATNGGGYLLEVSGTDLLLTVDDGAGVVLTLSRDISGLYDTPFTVATAIGPGGLMLAMSGDDAAAVNVVDIGDYSPPTAGQLLIGGAGAELIGGTLYHPYVFTASGLVSVLDDVSASYGGASVDEVASTGAAFSTITDGGVTYRMATFGDGGGVLEASGALDVEYLMLGGGGSGGDAGGGGGGGGAGRMLAGSASIAAGSHSVVVGLGGVGSRTSGGGTAALGLTALGGGGGGDDAHDIEGAEGGSSGGGRWSSLTRAAAVATYGGLGYAGGLGGPGGFRSGGGGGGAGGMGVDGRSTVAQGGGVGGLGVVSTITGAAIYYGGGGGGAAQDTAGAHGAGGVGGGGSGGNAGAPGVDGTGGGGGGGSGAGAGRGGSGVVIIRWAI